MRISSGANTSESRDGFRSCMTHAPKKTPIKKTATAEKWLSTSRKFPAAVATAPSTRLPVACPVKALASFCRETLIFSRNFDRAVEISMVYAAALSWFRQTFANYLRSWIPEIE
jgi:hypothetical protein